MTKLAAVKPSLEKTQIIKWLRKIRHEDEERFKTCSGRGSYDYYYDRLGTLDEIIEGLKTSAYVRKVKKQ